MEGGEKLRQRETYHLPAHYRVAPLLVTCLVTYFLSYPYIFRDRIEREEESKARKRTQTKSKPRLNLSEEKLRVKIVNVYLIFLIFSPWNFPSFLNLDL